jgi:hypothetical protein
VQIQAKLGALPPDGRKRSRFNTFFLGVSDQTPAWQIAERFIEFLRQFLVP